MSGSDNQTNSGRLSIRISPEVRQALEEIQRLGKLNSVADAVRRAIGDELFLPEQMNDGWNVLLQRGNTYRQVVWPKF